MTIDTNTNMKFHPEKGEDRIGSNYYVVCRAARCRLPNVDPETGIRHRHEPDETMRRYRCIDPGAGKLACLGMDLVPARPGELQKYLVIFFPHFPTSPFISSHLNLLSSPLYRPLLSCVFLSTMGLHPILPSLSLYTFQR